MLNEIKNRINKELVNFIDEIDRNYSLRKLNPLLFKSIKNFVLRKGKRIRPILFVIGYLGFVKRKAPKLYTSALSLELLHDFMLVHDDIIDKSDTRRGQPSMHKMINNHLSNYKDIKFDGQDLSIVIGDVMYAMAIHNFLAIKENMDRKEKALKKFIEAAIYTGAGELIELLNGMKGIKDITKKDIYNVYDYKTAYYTFACPLSTGAILAGAGANQTDKLFDCGKYLGRAFQIKDDILGIFSDEKKTGKSSITDLQEAKKTILIWHAYNNSDAKDRLYIERILSRKQVNRSDLITIRKIVSDCGTLDYARGEISRLIKEAQDIISCVKMHKKYKSFLKVYCEELMDFD